MKDSANNYVILNWLGIFLVVAFLLLGCTSRHQNRARVISVNQVKQINPRFRTDPNFVTYDTDFLNSIQFRWFDLVENMSYDAYRQGRVVVQFVLNYDGRITEMKVVESSVSETLALLCQKAVLDPAPFDKWPREMRLMVGEDSRRITFTFNYN